MIENQSRKRRARKPEYNLPELPAGCFPTLEHLKSHLDSLNEAFGFKDWDQMVHDAGLVQDIAERLQKARVWMDKNNIEKKDD